MTTYSSTQPYLRTAHHDPVDSLLAAMRRIVSYPTHMDPDEQNHDMRKIAALAIHNAALLIQRQSLAKRKPQ